MKLLAIDTSTKLLSAAITEDDNVLASHHDKAQLKHFDLLMPTIDGLLKQSSLKLKDIDAVALSIGPGSFTGLRIGVATCKGINLALGIPIVAVPTLDAIAYNFIDEKSDILCPLIDAKKERVYASLYKVVSRPHLAASADLGRLERITEYMLEDIDTVLKRIHEPTVVFGDACDLYGEHLKKNPHVRTSTKYWHPKAEVVAKLGFEKAKKKQFTNPDKLVPMYLHSKYCQVRDGK